MWWSCQALQTKQNWVRSAVKRELSGRWGKSNLGDSEGDIQLYFHLCSRETILWCGTEQIMKTSHRMEHINAVNFGSQGVKGDFCIEKCYECIFFSLFPSQCILLLQYLQVWLVVSDHWSNSTRVYSKVQCCSSEESCAFVCLFSAKIDEECNCYKAWSA